MCANAGSPQKPTMAGGVLRLAAGAAMPPMLPPQQAAPAPPGLVKPGAAGPLQVDKGVQFGIAPVKEGTMLLKEIDEQLTQAHRTRPAKVFMSDYACSVPALDPRVPVKKRLPEWTLS